MKTLFLALCTTVALAACGVESDYDSNADQLAANKTQCGGIAGFACPDGQTCLITEDYPDAMGTCVGHQEHLRVCPRIAVMCINGYVPVIAGNSCRWSCHPAGGAQQTRCRTAADCPNDPTGVMIMCIGSWSCDAGQCNYACGSTIEPL